MALFDPGQDGAPLAVLALGVVGDNRPLPDLQPPLPEGIHLRWAFDPTRGFPWWGFYLFRRLTLTTGVTTCAAAQLSGLAPGPRSSPDLAITLGKFHSDQNLVLTDDFPATGTVEVDLSEGTFVSFQMDPGQPSRHVDVQIGFVADFPTAGGTPGMGGAPGPGTAGGLGAGGSNSLMCGCGCDHAAIQPIAEGVVAIGPGQYRATFGYENAGASPTSMPDGPENRFFPDPQDRGQPTLLVAGRQTGVFSVVFDGRPLSWRLAGNTVTVSAADAQQGTGTGGGAAGGANGAGIVVTALRLGVTVVTRVASGRAGQVVTVPLDFEAIDEIQVTSGPARLVDICAIRNTDGGGQGWAPVPSLTQPITLPARAQKYPIRQGVPNLTESQTLAVGRISYAFPVAGTTQLDTSEWQGANFAVLHQVLLDILQLGPPTITEHLQDVTADPDPSDPNALQPTWSQQSSLGLLLSASVNPAVAQMLGLYWVDATTVEGQSYDYMLVADYHNAANGNVNTIQALVTAQNFTSIDAYKKVGVARAVTAPLAPPDAATLQAYALPLRSVPASAPGDSAGLIGLRWDVPNASDQTTKIAPTSSILFHVWRKDFGRAGPGQTETFDPETFTKETDSPVAPGQPRVQDPPAIPLAGWPSASLFDVDGPLVEGWYSYRVSGIDIFGRYSARSDLAPWLNQDGSLQDSRAVHIIDTTPPPPPSRVQAWLLDPLDPFVLQDAAYTTWRNANPIGIGLRVRWAWGAQQRRQAPDAFEFRIYLNAGSQLVNPSVPTSWSKRIAIVGLGEQLLPQSLLPLQTADGQNTNIVGQSVSVSGTQVTLLDGPSLGGVLAGEAELQLVVNSVGSQFAVVNVDADNRIITVDQSVQDLGPITTWALLPLRTYEVFLPGTTLATPSVFTSPPDPPRDTPVAYSLVGVSAADDKDRTDDRTAIQPLTPRPGNEGNVGGPSTIVQILRTPPDPPPAPYDQDSLSATRADFRSRSFFTLHAVKQPTPQLPAMAVHVYRAVDETVFQVDAVKGFAPGTRTAEANAISLTALGPSWTAARRTAAANELGALTAPTAATPTTYANLSNDGLRLLASLPSNVAAFSCITRTPLPADTADDRGLSDLPTYDPTARADLTAFTDILDGRATNRYFYRTTLVDAAQNQSDLSVATPPVTLPVTALPEAPRLPTAVGGDRAITLSLLAVADPTVVSYRIYRADSRQAGNDLRTMQAIATVSDSRLATDRPNPLPVPPDTDIVPYQDYFYRATAILPAGGESPPSAVMSARAFDGSPPPEPTWERSEWVKLDASGVEHPFTDTDPGLASAVAVRVSFASGTVARMVVQVLNGSTSTPASPWLDAQPSTGTQLSTFATYLRTLSPTIAQTLRSRAVSNGGREALSQPRSVPVP